MASVPKNKVIIVLACFAVAGAVFAFFEQRNKPLEFTNSAGKDGVALGEAIFKNISSKDSDNDGLKDWEEPLWKTNLNNPDSDGDGTKDGEETALGRNPAVKGPNDSLDDHPPESSTAATAGNDTEHMTKELISRYLSIKQSTEFDNLSEAEKAKVIQETLLSVSFPARTIRTYSAADIRVATAETSESLFYYGGNMGKIFYKYAKETGVGEELPQIEMVMNGSKSADAAGFEKIAADYEKLATELVKIEAPPGLFEEHLKIINGVLALAQNIREFTKFKIDPLATLLAVNEYRETVSLIGRNIDSMAVYFTENFVGFEENTYGEFFLSLFAGA